MGSRGNCITKLNMDAYRSVLGIVTKCGRESFPKECPDRGTHNGTYNAIILERGERSQVVMSYAEVTREYGKTPLGQNRLTISYIIYFIKV